MICTKCQREIAEYSNFCYYCGARQNVAHPGTARGPKPLVRAAEGRVFGGVLTGLAAYLDVDVVIVRIVYVLVSVFTGVFPGVVAYLIGWMIIPDSSAADAVAPAATVATSSPRRFYRSRTGKKLGGVCAGIAEYSSMDVSLVRLLWVLLSVIPGAVVLGLVSYFVCWIVIPEAPDAMPSAAPSAAPQHS